jgi:hypothetical protein
MHIFSAKTQTIFYWKSWTIITISKKLTLSLAKMLDSNDPRPISRTNMMKICVRYISTRFLIIRFHIIGEYLSENSFLCLPKSCAKRSWTYITLYEWHVDAIFNNKIKTLIPLCYLANVLANMRAVIHIHTNTNTHIIQSMFSLRW